MNKEIFRKIPKGIKLAVVLILLTAIALGIWFFASKSVRLPAEFLTARQRERKLAKKLLS